MRFKATAIADSRIPKRRWYVYIRDANDVEVFSQMGSGTISNQPFNVLLATGAYRIYVQAYGDMVLGQIYDNSASISGDPVSNEIKGIGYVSQTKIGNDGFFSFWHEDRYLYYSSTDGLSIKGNTDIPGVLASGKVGTTTAHTNRWGAKISTNDVTYTATGIYDVPHNAGDTYMVLVQAIGNGIHAYLISQGNNTFRVQLKDSTGSSVEGHFNYTIFGNN